MIIILKNLHQLISCLYEVDYLNMKNGILSTVALLDKKADPVS